MIPLSRSRSDQHCTVGNSEYLEDIERNDGKWYGGGVQHLYLKLVIGGYGSSQEDGHTYAAKSHIGNSSYGVSPALSSEGILICFWLKS